MYHPEKDTLLFQCKDILSRDAFPDSPLDSDDDRRSADSAKQQKMYQILLFGTDPQGQSVALQITNFKPYFYVRIPDCLATNDTAKKNLQSWILDGVPQDSLYAVALDYVDHGVLIDYNGGNKGTFLKITVPTIALWRTLKDRVLDKGSTPIGYDTRSLFGIGAVGILAKHAPTGDIHSATPDGKRVALKVYEANIDPVLRFFHLQDISPAGWIQVPINHWEFADSDDAKVKVYAVAEWTDVQSAADAGMAPFLVGSWDIECNSAHGDFPIPIKNWKKSVREFQETGIPTTVQEMVQQLANAVNHKPGKLSPIYINTRKHHFPVTVESLTTAIASTKREGQFKNALAALRVAENADARDKAIFSLDKLLTSTFPPIAGDEIIQIGIVLYRKTKPVSKHIWVLNSVDENAVRPPGEMVPIEVFSYEDEATLLRAWFQWLGRTDPDILIGYNIFGFDSQYVWDRLVELVGEKEASRITSPLSSLKSRPTKLEEKFLSSSAMGDNTLHFMSSPGRLQIDLLPYIRRNHNLDSYSLDNVSATFVSGGVKSLAQLKDEEFVVTTKSTKGTVAGRFITLMDDENDRIVEKAEVLAVEPTKITIRIKGGKAKLEDNGGIPTKWAQVKDDVSPKDIFRFHRGTPQERGIVARYCLQDCDLVMELFNKLDILNNSVAMANVCSVPVSFIFLRG